MKCFAVWEDNDGKHRKEFTDYSEAWTYLNDMAHGWMRDVEDEHGESIDPE